MVLWLAPLFPRLSKLQLTLVLLLLINRLVTRPISGLVLTMDHGTQEIADANQNLADRTNRQSASLEETAASMEEMESIVKNNADEAKTLASW